MNRNALHLLVAFGVFIVAADASARFVSVDPVQANPNNGANFNRYTYANNNPYKFADPDGRAVVFALRNGATFEDQASAMSYLMSSSTAAGEVSQIHFSEQTYTISIDRGQDAAMGYNADTRTVTLNPTSGLKIESSGKIQSPSLGGLHEISHAAEHDRIGTEAFKANLEAPLLSVKNRPGGGMSVTYGASVVEKRATSVETKVGGELGEATRNKYSDSAGSVTTCSATSTKQC